MNGGELIREARRRAGLTQSELAASMGTAQSTIVRWERGERSPTFEIVSKAASLCGLKLRVGLSPPDESALGVARSMSLLTAEQKLEANRNLVGLRGLAADRSV